VIAQQEKKENIGKNINKQLHNTHNKARSTDNCPAHGICQPTSIMMLQNEQESGVFH